MGRADLSALVMRTGDIVGTNDVALGQRRVEEDLYTEGKEKQWDYRWIRIDWAGNAVRVTPERRHHNRMESEEDDLGPVLRQEGNSTLPTPGWYLEGRAG